ncbi:hypothetical protein Patl1_34404 [Pistacia atlantica]|uniref:Uncharacterized protein n=1 Tax=Pistacia atlantica TaxID=434234 RepID=A0ACC0ZSW9_9ROSI|nr:hypothetical protein Patl1_34404 [Pistacia atlantica]
MSESSAKLRKGANKNQKRNLPSWMSSSEHGSKSHGKKSTDADNDDEKEKTEETKQAKGHDKAVGGGSPSNKTEHSKKSAASSSSTANFSKLLEGVVFVLSGFVNPERSMMRSQAIEMGAAYQADWNSDCTLLVCAFPNTPKFRQVEADCGTIISKRFHTPFSSRCHAECLLKALFELDSVDWLWFAIFVEWIIECYNQKKLVDIEKFLMHAGKPWRKGNISHKTGEEENPSKKSQKVEKGSKLMPTTSSSSKNKTSNPGKERFSPSELKRWAADDLNKTISWLESQEEKPEESEIKQIAAEGILICMQDAIDSIEQKQGVQHIMEQWQCIPRVVQELGKLEGKGSAALSNGDLCSQAKAWKQIYEEELQRLDGDSVSKKQKQKTNESESERSNNGRSTATRSDAAGYDSDETIEMTEEEIELAYKNLIVHSRVAADKRHHFTALTSLSLSHNTKPSPFNQTLSLFQSFISLAMGASLPPKEANLFKLIVKSYETKQYKKGLKAADAILKKFPDHGETLSMKGLTLNCMDRKSEAYELVRVGVKNDIKSHVCWHVYGLLYRSDREYREAIKCYRNALRIDPDNIEILRDLSLLQAQMRDLAGFVETRQQLLTLKPNHRMNWIGFAVAHHLNSNGSKAVEILEAYEGTLEDDYPPDNERCEHGEMLLYKISLLEECGSLKRALEELHKKELKIVDKLAYKEQEVSLLVKLGLLEEAAKLYRVLLSMNPDNYKYYEGLQKCVGLYSENGNYSSDEIDQLDALYESLGKQYTWSSAVKRIPLDFLQGDKFREAAFNYIRPLLTKGVPSLFSDLSPLYGQPGKADILEHLILELEHSIRTTGRCPGR